MFGEFWPHRTMAWARMALPRSLPTLPPARSRSTWSARSEARTYDVDGRRVTAILGYEVGPEPIHNQGLQDRQLGPELTRKWGQNSPAKPTERVRTANASQVPARLLIQTGRRLDQLTMADLDELAAACRIRQQRTGDGWRHCKSGLSCTQRVLFHLGILAAPPASGPQPASFADRLAGITPPIAEANGGLPGTQNRHLQAQDCLQPGHPADAFRPFPHRDRPGTGHAGRTRPAPSHRALPGQPGQRPEHQKRRVITVGERLCRVLAAGNFLTDITQWGWDDAPARRLIFPGDTPRLPQVLPRYLPVDADRRLADALRASPYELAASALLLQRACGLRIGELPGLELDCVHEVPGSGAWLKVSLGKLDTERMVPLDAETLDLAGRITEPAHRDARCRIPATAGSPSSCSHTTSGGCPSARSARSWTALPKPPASAT
jgi:hypothetical protein